MRYRFGELILDLGTGRLESRDGELQLRPQAFRLLAVLVEEAPRVLSQDELLDRVWGAEHLSSNSVRQAVSELRTVLGDPADRPRFIATVHRRGYRFVAPLERIEDPAPEPPVPAPRAPERQRPRRVSARTLRWAAAAVVVAVLGFAAVQLLVARGRAPASPEARPSLAVLPFANLGLEAGSEWMGGAVAEVLRYELSGAGRLRLVPGETVARMGQELSLERKADYGSETLAAIGANLGVEWVVAGAYLPVTGSESGELLLQAQVRRTADAAVIAWAQETCTPEELAPGATRLARALQASLGVSVSAGDPAGLWMPDAHTLRLYSQALELLRREEAQGARALLEEALPRSPENSLIHDALSTAYGLLGFDALARDESKLALEHGEALPRSLRLAIEARALALDGHRDEAVARWQALWQFYPDEAEHGLQLARAQRSAGRFHEALDTLATLRSTLPASDGDPRVSRLEADLLADLGNFDAARDRALQSINEAAERGTPLLAIEGYRSHAWALGKLGDIPGALASLERAEALSVQMRSPLGQIFALSDRAQLLQRTGQLEAAEEIYRKVLELLRERGTRKAEATALNNFASLLSSRNDLAGAAAVLERSVELKREIGDSRGLVTSLTNLANIHRVLGAPEVAAVYLEESVERARQLGLPEELAASLRSLAYLRAREGSYEVARALFTEALEASASEEAKADSFFGLATVEGDLGELEGSLHHLEAAASIYRRLGHSESLAQARNNLADLQLRLGDVAGARSGFEEVLALAQGLESSVLEAHARMGLGQVAEADGDLPTARREHQRALRLFDELQQEKEAERCRKALARLDAGVSDA